MYALTRDAVGTSSRGTGRGPRRSSSLRRRDAPARTPPRPRDACRCETCGSWFGSPRRTTESAAAATAADIRQRELAGLVDEEDVDGARRTRCRAQSHAVPPTTSTVPPPSAPSAASCRRVVDEPVHLRPLVVVALWPMRIVSPASRAAFATASSRLPMTLCDWAVTPTRFPVADEREDHPRRGPGLAGPRRTLDGERAAVEPHRDPHGGLERGFAVADQRPFTGSPVTRGRRPQDPARGRPGLARPFDLVGDHVVREPAEGARASAPSRTAWPGSMREDAVAPALRLRSIHPDPDVEVDDLAGALAGWRDRSGCLARLQLDLLGGIEPIAVDRGAGDRIPTSCSNDEVTERRTVRDEVLHRGLPSSR